MTKTIDDYFSDWGKSVFGFGYGDRERHIIPAIKTFMSSFGTEYGAKNYDYEKLERACGATVAWLMINALCRAEIIEYGSSTRFGWLTDEGERLRDYIIGHSSDHLVKTAIQSTDYIPCYPTACNCGPSGYVEGKKCSNPFWKS